MAFLKNYLGDRYDSNHEIEPRFVKGVAIRPVPIALGNFWVTFAVGGNFFGSSNLEQRLPFWAKLGLDHISNLKNSTISLKTSEVIRISCVFINRKVSLNC